MSELSRRRFADWRTALADHPIVRPTGRSNWILGSALGVILGAVLIGGSLLDRTDLAARIGLGMILVSLPSIPATFRDAIGPLAARGAAVVLAAGVIAVTDAGPLLVSSAVLIAAAAGAFLPWIRATAALAFLLGGLREQIGDRPGIPCLGEALGAAAVIAVAAGAALLRRHSSSRIRPGAPGATDTRASTVPGTPADAPSTAGARLSERWRADLPHAARMAASVATALVVVAVSGIGLAGGHWLITAVLLSMQRSGSATRLRVAQRLLGNTVGAVLVAVIMATGPSGTVMGALAAVLFCLAFSLRSRSYLWWAVTAPPVLLIVGEFPVAHNWYDGGVRVLLGVAGAAIVFGVFWLLPERFRRG